jgi:hypothetical protein
MTENKVEGGEDMTENTMVECNECGTEYDSEQAGSEYAGSPICDDCSRFCERCESTTSENDSYVISGRNIWCQDCRDEHAFYCSQCSEYYDQNYVGNHYFDGSDYCEDCINEVAEWCEHCEEWEYENRRCEDHRRANGGYGIHQYSYKPDPIFLGKDKHSLYMGWELEADTQYHNQDEASAYASTMLEEENNLAYLKADGSVSRGFEIVTHPIAHNELRGTRLDPYWDTIESLRTDYQFRSWDSEASCGLHIHLSRKGFSNGAHLHRFLQFIYRNPEMMMKFAGRKSDDYATFQDVWRYDEYDRPYRAYSHKLDYVPNRPLTFNRLRNSIRGSAVNTNNEHTIELRFFRGTLNKKGILACLDMAHAGVEYTRLLNTRDVIAGMLSWDMFYEWVSDNNGIYPELYDRMPKCRSVDIKNRVMINA